MSEPKFYMLLLSALIPLFIGMIWYNPKVFGTAWMNASGMTEEKAKGANMLVVFILTYIFSILISFILSGIVIHQAGVFSVFEGDTTPEAKEYLRNFMEKYGDRFRTFKHGVLHGVIAGIGMALPIIGINAMFERKGFKYIAINTGYWILCFALMGGFICAML